MSMRLSTADYAALVKRMGQQPPAPPKPASINAPTPTLVTLLETIQALAKAHGWLGAHSYNSTGPDAGLHCTLVREAVLFAEVKEEGQPLTPGQRRWQEALRRTGQVEVYTWHPSDLTAIEERLSRKEV